MGHHVRQAQLRGSAGLASEGVQRGVADELHRIAQRQREDRGRGLVGVVVEKPQAVTAHDRVRMVKPPELDLTDGSVGCNGRPSLGR
jgi:hypothetical protein